jgi:hypothetical protein
MAERYDLKTPRKGKDGKTWWTKIGVAFPMKERDGFNLTFEALPVPQLNDRGELEVRVTMWPPFETEKPLMRKAEDAQAPLSKDRDIPF